MGKHHKDNTPEVKILNRGTNGRPVFGVDTEESSPEFSDKLGQYGPVRLIDRATRSNEPPHRG